MTTQTYTILLRSLKQRERLMKYKQGHVIISAVQHKRDSGSF